MKTFKNLLNYVKKAKSQHTTLGGLFCRLVQFAVELSVGSHTYLPDQNFAQGLFSITVSNLYQGHIFDAKLFFPCFLLQ